MGCLGEELKVVKVKDLGDLGKNKHGQTEG